MVLRHALDVVAMVILPCEARGAAVRFAELHGRHRSGRSGLHANALDAVPTPDVHLIARFRFKGVIL